MKMNIKEKINLEGNINKFCFMNFFDGMWFATPVFVVFLSDNHIGLAQFGIILGAYPLMQLLFDIPSSLWADRYSRKLILIVGSIACMLQNIIYATAGSFEMFFLGSCLNGLGMALSGGTFSALIYDTLLSLGREKEYEKTQLKVMKSYFLGKIIVAILGVYVYLINPRAVFSLSVLMNLVHLAFTVSLREPPREKSISQSFDQIREGLGFLLKRKAIWNTIIIFAVMSASCDVLAEYYQPVMQVSKIPVAYFGVIYFFASLSQYLGASIYPRIKSRIDWRSVMVVYLLVVVFCSIIFSAHLAALVVLAVMLRSVASGSQSTYISSIVHNVVPSSHRATTMSINNLIYMLFFLVFLYAVGFSMDRSSVAVGMLLNAGIALLTLLVFLKLNYGKRSAGNTASNSLD